MSPDRIIQDIEQLDISATKVKIVVAQTGHVMCHKTCHTSREILDTVADCLWIVRTPLGRDLVIEMTRDSAEKKVDNT